MEECTLAKTILVDSVLWSVSLKEDLLYTPEQNTVIKDHWPRHHCEVRLTFSLRFSLRFSFTFSLRFKQTIELHPDVNLSSYSSAVPFQYRNTIFSGAVHRNFIKFTYVV